jgi:hypothetical protein
MLVNFSVPSDVFAYFWMATEATHGSPSSFEIELKPGGDDYLNVTNVGLSESMSPSPPGLHPVVAELRDMREQLKGLARQVLIGFWVVAAILVLLKMFR